MAKLPITAIIIACLLPACRPAPQFAEVTVVGTDYAFQMPDTLTAGLTAFAFENQGQVRHELGITRLQEGVTLGDVFGDTLGVPQDSLYGPDVGVLFSRPGEEPAGRLLTDLEAGGTYLVWCDFRDSLDARRHSQMGMIRLLHVR